MRDEFRRLIGFWLQQDVDGFRIDAAPFMINLLGLKHALGLSEAHEFLRDSRDVAITGSANAILPGEVDVDLSVMADYFGGSNELQALFNFPLNRRLFLALTYPSCPRSPNPASR